MHSQRADKQGRVHLHPSPAMLGNRVRVLIPGSSRKAPLPNADSGAGRVALAHPRILRWRVAGRTAGVVPLACLQSLWDSGQAGLGQTGRGPESPIWVGLDQRKKRPGRRAVHCTRHGHDTAG